MGSVVGGMATRFLDALSHAFPDHLSRLKKDFSKLQETLLNCISFQTNPRRMGAEERRVILDALYPPLHVPITFFVK
jgi:hypothetical protein